ncbi:hypothetical protein DLAC_08893 [Tieghemostelium lacteum]|uniref:Transmembrane protein n=1 Tax=Tieghemostelium lacteum TaxID=361077 RepID=A0A151Z8N9_TIELA|nr:hypothetical protein DLAC_08893 [Tieghemostelium lacteum]|eukprot:KYQ90288.1 hypothetical protein DLAC_08893 [Tieghemostelium lacteum]
MKGFSLLFLLFLIEIFNSCINCQCIIYIRVDSVNSNITCGSSIEDPCPNVSTAFKACDYVNSKNPQNNTSMTFYFGSGVFVIPNDISFIPLILYSNQSISLNGVYGDTVFQFTDPTKHILTIMDSVDALPSDQSYFTMSNITIENQSISSTFIQVDTQITKSNIQLISCNFNNQSLTNSLFIFNSIRSPSEFQLSNCQFQNITIPSDTPIFSMNNIQFQFENSQFIHNQGSDKNQSSFIEVSKSQGIFEQCNFGYNLNYSTLVNVDVSSTITFSNTNFQWNYLSVGLLVSNSSTLNISNSEYQNNLGDFIQLQSTSTLQVNNLTIQDNIEFRLFTCNQSEIQVQGTNSIQLNSEGTLNDCINLCTIKTLNQLTDDFECPQKPIQQQETSNSESVDTSKSTSKDKKIIIITTTITLSIFLIIFVIGSYIYRKYHHDPIKDEYIEIN